MFKKLNNLLHKNTQKQTQKFRPVLNFCNYKKKPKETKQNRINNNKNSNNY